MAHRRRGGDAGHWRDNQYRCISNVTHALKAITGVHDVALSLSTGRSYGAIRQTADLADQLKSAVKGADYKSSICGSVQTEKKFASIRDNLAASNKLILPKETHTMDATTRTALVIAFVVVALLLLLFGGGMMTGTMMSGGMMGSGSMGGFNWMWLPTLLVVVIGIVLFSVIFGKK